MSTVSDNNINEILERRQTRSGTPLGRSSVEKTGTNQKKSVLRQRTRAQTGSEVSTITEVIETQTTEVVFTGNSVTSDTVDVRSLKGRQKKSVSVERTKNTDGANSVSTLTNKEPQLYKATRRLFEQEENDSEEVLADSTTRESQVFDYSSYSSDDGSGKPVRAYDIYRRAGEYWNVFPKTDFTYSPTSQDRREIAPGVINIPNMSRRGLHQDGQGRLRSPTRYHSITSTSKTSRWNSHSTSTPKVSQSKLQFWSSLDSDSDEVDSEVRRRRVYTPPRPSRLVTVGNWFTTYWTAIWTVITTCYTTVLYKGSQVLGGGGVGAHLTGEHSRHVAAVSERSSIYSRLVSSVFSKIWDLSTWIVSVETWLLSRLYVGDKAEGGASVVDNRRRNWKLLWLVLIPFLLLAGIFLFQENPISLPDIHAAVPDFVYKVPGIFHGMFRSLHVIPDFICSLPDLMYHAALKIVEFFSKIPSLLYSVPELFYKVPALLSPISGAAYGILESFYKILLIFPHTFLLVKEMLLSLF